MQENYRCCGLRHLRFVKKEKSINLWGLSFPYTCADLARLGLTPAWQGFASPLQHYKSKIPFSNRDSFLNNSKASSNHEET